MIIIEKYKPCVGEILQGCTTCGDQAYWVVRGVGETGETFFCHPHLCILASDILKVVEK